MPKTSQRSRLSTFDGFNPGYNNNILSAIQPDDIKTINEEINTPLPTEKESLDKNQGLIRRDSKVGPKIGAKIFEEFFVIGSNKSDLAKFELENSSSTSTSLEPGYIFSFPKDSSLLNTYGINSVTLLLFRLKSFML